jgi:hypothetical protein
MAVFLTQEVLDAPVVQTYQSDWDTKEVLSHVFHVLDRKHKSDLDLVYALMTMDPEQDICGRCVIELKGRVVLDYRRSASVYVVKFDGAPAFIATGYGREESDGGDIVVIDQERTTALIVHIQSIHTRREAEKLVKVLTKPDLPIPKYADSLKLGVSVRDAF